MIAIIDYGAGNIRNVLRALTHLGYSAQITADPEVICKAQATVLPGVGAAGDTVRALQARGLDQVIRRLIEEDRATNLRYGHYHPSKSCPSQLRRVVPTRASSGVMNRTMSRVLMASTAVRTDEVSGANSNPSNSS